jgi:hypothetical protein
MNFLPFSLAAKIGIELPTFNNAFSLPISLSGPEAQDVTTSQV